MKPLIYLSIYNKDSKKIEKLFRNKNVNYVYIDSYDESSMLIGYSVYKGFKEIKLFIKN